ncbi:MAG: transglycosylase SLT domain-containing protein [Pseudomarimonas sp.]
MSIPLPTICVSTPRFLGIALLGLMTPGLLWGGLTVLGLSLLKQPALAIDRSQIEAQRGPFRAALERAERGAPLTPSIRQTFFDHPLLPWLEYAELRHDLSRSSVTQIDTLRRRYPQLGFAEPLRKLLLHELARRRDWHGYRAHFEAAVDSEIELQCHALTAEINSGRMDVELKARIADLWRFGDSRPAACDVPFEALSQAGGITVELRWERIMLAAESGNSAFVRLLARKLPAAEKLQAERHAAYLDAPSAKLALAWPATQRNRQIAAIGASRVAKSDPAAGERLLIALKPLGLTIEQEGLARYQAALWSAASYLPGTALRMAAVPASAFDDRLHEWRAREALARADWRQTLDAIIAMPDSLRADPRWRYLQARMHELLGEALPAKQQFAALAREPNYHGFLAADRLDQPYALCPLEIDAKSTQHKQVAAAAGLLRARELKAIGRDGWAELEWKQLLAGLDATGRHHAVSVALEARWNDRAVFSMATPEDQRYYSLRFPFAHRNDLRKHARKHGLDEAWVAALIRAESAWQPRARSSADARGLMQLLPSTAAATARQQGVAWNGGDTLYDPRANIALGTAYLAAMLARHGGQPYLATAAYNAGPAPIGRWLAQRAAHDVDLWVETIPYRETREYVGRIMAFSVIYDWRLHGAAMPLAARMRGITAKRRALVCPTPVAQTVQTP